MITFRAPLTDEMAVDCILAPNAVLNWWGDQIFEAMIREIDSQILDGDAEQTELER